MENRLSLGSPRIMVYMIKTISEVRGMAKQLEVHVSGSWRANFQKGRE